MSTNPDLELRGVSLINEPALPTKSQHYLKEKYRKDREMALYQRDLRELDNYQMMEYKHDLVETLDIKGAVKNDLIAGNYEIVDAEKAMKVPYRRAA